MGRPALLLLAAALAGAAVDAKAQLLGLNWQNRETRSCTAQQPPKPAGLTASVLAEGTIALSWAAGDASAPPPTGSACISGYTIVIAASGQPTSESKRFITQVRASNELCRRKRTPVCRRRAVCKRCLLPSHSHPRHALPCCPQQATSATISKLVPSQRYTVEVRALSSRGYPASPAATLTSLRPTRAAGAASAASGGSTAAAALQGWRCVAKEGYNVCSAGRAGLCEPASCAEMVRRHRSAIWGTPLGKAAVVPLRL